MGRYQQYSEYVHMKSEWWKQLPTHWATASLKQLCTKITDGSHFSPKTEDVGRPYVTVRNLNDGIVDTGNAEKISEEAFHELERSGCRPKCGDVLFSKDGTIGKVALVTEDNFVVLSSLAILRPGSKHLKSKYLKYLLLSPNGMRQIESYFAGAALKRITLDVIVDLVVSVPPLNEQESIATFLDHETTKIDRLIAKQERLIELLKEKRQAVISHAVTKGLNPHVPMKDSGVEWLGEVPVHWDVARVKFVAKLESGHTPSKQVEEYWVDCSIPWVSLNDSKQLAHVDYISDTAVQINEKGLAGSSARLLPLGAVVFTRDATIGLTAITSRAMAVSQHLIAWLPRDRITSLFLLRVFNAMKDELDRFTFGATIKTIGMDDVKSLTTTVPPMDEQEAICRYIDEQLARFDLLIDKAEHQIGLLKEHRVSLISSAVTGKIDVRGSQTPESEETVTATSA